jgi:hypothetical protein
MHSAKRSTVAAIRMLSILQGTRRVTIELVTLVARSSPLVTPPL